MRALWIGVGLSALSLLAPAGRAEVYVVGGEGDAKQASMSKDPSAELPQVRVHDLVTIRIKDLYKFSNDVKSDQKKEYDLQMELADWFRITGRGARLRAEPGRRVASRARDEGSPLELGIESEKESKGSSKQTEKTELQASVTAEVVEVRPNGTIVLEARKVTQKDENKQTLILTGVARIQDIGQDNAVDSSQVANMFLKILHEGPGADATKRGWFAKVIDKVWPF